MNNKNSSSFIHLNGEGYEGLALVLQAAFNQATAGKGKERHAQDLPFDEQPMQTISSLLGTQKGMLFQAVKKIQESTRMDTDAAIKELLGAIVYTAGAVIFLQNQQLNQWKQEAKAQPVQVRTGNQEAMKPVPPVPTNDNAPKSVLMCKCGWTTKALCEEGRGFAPVCLAVG